MKLKIEYRPLASLLPYAGNVMDHPEDQIRDLARGIEQFGFNNPIAVDAKGQIIAGHGRLLAAKRLGLSTVPVITLSHLTDAQKRAYAIADNKLSHRAEWNVERLTAELSALTDLDIDLSLTGFDSEEIAKYVADLGDAVERYVQPTIEQPTPPSAPTGQAVAAPTVEGTEEAQAQKTYEPPAYHSPKASDDEYSLFELVMRHENKLRLLETLNHIKQARAFDKHEDALMWLVDQYED